jgi:2-phosphosulfolactate phosphatase
MIYYTLEVRMKLDVIATPALLKEDTLKGCFCAVIDVLRATSTIITALASGAKEVRPCLTVDEAKKGVAKLPRDFYLLGGEDMGKNIPGSDLGNSPLEYMAGEVVGDKVIYSYTSNGTGAIRKAYAGSGQPVYIAALINVSAAASAIVKAAGAQGGGIAIVCAGRYGGTSTEDFFCAGMMVDRIARGLRKHGIEIQLGDAASAASDIAAANRGHGLNVLSSSEHGRFLESIGFADDLIFASRIDLYNVVPVFDGERVVLLQ